MIPPTTLVQGVGKEYRPAAHTPASDAARRHALRILLPLVIGAATAGVVVANAELLRLTVEADTPLGELGAAVSPDSARAAPLGEPGVEAGASRLRANEYPSPEVTRPVVPSSSAAGASPTTLGTGSSTGISVGVSTRTSGDEGANAPPGHEDEPSAPKSPQPPQTPQAEPIRAPAQASDPDTDDESEDPREDEPESEEPEHSEEEAEPEPEPGGLVPGIGQ